MTIEQQALDLIAENEVLKCQVNELRRCLNGDMKGGFLFNMSTGKGRVEFYEKKNAVLDKTPEQCLNSVKADAINSLIEDVGTCDQYDKGIMYIEDVMEYIENI